MFQLPLATGVKAFEDSTPFNKEVGAYQLLHFMRSGMSGHAMDGFRELLAGSLDPATKDAVLIRLEYLMKTAFTELCTCPVCGQHKNDMDHACPRCHGLARAYLEGHTPSDNIKRLAKLIEEDSK